MIIDSGLLIRSFPDRLFWFKLISKHKVKHLLYNLNKTVIQCFLKYVLISILSILTRNTQRMLSSVSKRCKIYFLLKIIYPAYWHFTFSFPVLFSRSFNMGTRVFQKVIKISRREILNPRFSFNEQIKCQKSLTDNYTIEVSTKFISQQMALVELKQ